MEHTRDVAGTLFLFDIMCCRSFQCLNTKIQFIPTSPCGFIGGSLSPGDSVLVDNPQQLLRRSVSSSLLREFVCP